MQTLTNPNRAPALEALRVNTIVGRAIARISQQELAERAGLSRPTISRIERGATGDVGIETVERIAGVLGVTVADLFIPVTEDRWDDDELLRRAATDRAEFIDARALLEAVDEAAGRPIKRYSRAGRPSVVR